MKKCLSIFLFVFLIGIKICYAESPATIMEKYGKAVVLLACVKSGGEEIGLGSGFIVSSTGVIITNYHVIENAYPIIVKLTNGDIYDKIFVVDADKRRDIAILKIKAFGLPIVTLGNSDNIKVGEKVIVIGNPKGLENSISDGLLSAVRESGLGYKMYQMTAPISPGSSGSPVFNDKGEVIGIATSSLVEGQNLNFCVPINYARGAISETPKMSLEEFTGREKEIAIVDIMSGKDKFVVYDEQSIEVTDGYVPSGWMGDYAAIKAEYSTTNNPHSGVYCQKWIYSGKKTQGVGWAGVCWQNPPNNWGTMDGGFNLSKFTKLNFWARGENGGEIIQFGMGGILGKYQDSTRTDPMKISLTKEWKQYTIDLKGKNLKHIICGFMWIADKAENPKGCTFYLDDIVYE